MLSSIILRGGRGFIWVVDRDSRLIRGKKVPVPSNNEGSSEGHGKGIISFLVEFLSKLGGLVARKPMIMNVPESKGGEFTLRRMERNPQ